MKTVSPRLEGAHAVVSESNARLEALVERYRPFIREIVGRLCPRHLGAERNEIEQHVIIRFWRSIERETEIRNFESYLYRIVATVTLDVIREIKSRQEEPLEEEHAERLTSNPALPASRARSAEESLADKEVLERVEKVIDEFSAERRRAIRMHLLGFTPEEVGSLLGWSEPKARNTIYRSMRELRDRLGKLHVDAVV